MAEPHDDLERAREDARRAADEARRLHDHARELARQLHRSARARHGGPPDGRSRPGPFDGPSSQQPEDGADASGSPEGARAFETFSLDGVTSVSINQTAGKLTIRACAKGETPGVEASSNKTPPQVEVSRQGTRLTIAVKLSVGWLFRRKHGASTVIRLGDGLEELRVNNGAGELLIHELACGVFELNTGAGEIKTFRTSGNLRADTGAGRIQLTAHRGLARCDTGTGDVSMDIAEVAPGEYRANVGMGRAEVRLPAGSQVHFRVASGIGKARVEYPDAGEGAPTTVRVDTGIGEATVKVRQAAPEAGMPPPPSGSPKPQREGREAANRRRRESEELRVLQLLEQGRISTQEAADLIAALHDVRPPTDDDE